MEALVTDSITDRRRSNSGRTQKMTFESDYNVQPSGTTSPRVPETSIAAFESQGPEIDGSGKSSGSSRPMLARLAMRS